MRDFEPAVPGKQGRVWAGPQPTLCGVPSRGSDLEPAYPWRPLGLPGTPLPLAASGPVPRDLVAGRRALHLDRLAQPRAQEALQGPVTPPPGLGGVQGGGTCGEANKTSGADGR